MFIAFGTICLSIATFYFYIFARSKERFIKYWGLCWLCYSCSLLFLILDTNEDYAIFLELRKIFDMFHILFLLFGVYTFQNFRIPGYWTRFSLYLMIWALLSILYDFDLLSLYLPISMFQVCVTTMICYLVLRTWKVSIPERLTASLVFGLWGFGKVMISIVEAINIENISSYYLAEIIFLNVLNFIVFIIYLQRSEFKLDVTRKQFKLIVENALDVIFIYQINPPSFSYITPSAEKVLGYVPQDFYNDNKFYLQLVNREDFDKINSLFDYRTFGSAQKENTEILKIYLKNSQEIWAEITTTTVYEDQIPIALEGVIRDVTVMKKAEIEMLASKKSREVFFSYISHELKTPITSILAYITALKDDTITDETKRTEALDIIYKKILLLNRLVYDVFQISKLEIKQFSFAFMVMDGQNFVNELIGNHYHDFKRADLKLELKIQENVLKNVSVIADSARMEQVFANIVDNAIRFSEKGKSIKINFGIDAKKEHLEFSVKDYGLGISEEDLPHIFDRFYQVNGEKPSSSEVTSGLGMTIAKEIVEAHGGIISVKSRINKGTTFKVSLPLYFEKEE